MNRDEDIFSDACALPLAERAAFLDRACASDSAQRARLDELLAGISEGDRMMPTAFVPRVSLPTGEKPSDWIGRYKLLEKIGEGGCGIVWMAQQEEPVRRRVALKVIKLGMDTKEVIARFEAERQALALMEHPNIAKVLDAGATASGRPYFVMELVRGVPITRYCDGANLSTTQRLELFAQVCHAIQHAHEKGIVHRDIKPSNILVAQHDHLAVPKVIDFGIAKATQGRLTDATLFTAFEQFIGTPAYMSPEQAEFSGLEVDTRSDVYSLGVLLYELLAGRPPFDPKSLQQAGIDEIRRIIREVEPPRPSTRLSTMAASDRTALAKLRGAVPTQHSTQLSGDLDWIVMHCLEKDRSRRYATANELALDLGRHLRHEPVVACPPSVAYRTGKLLRRHRFGFAAAAVVGLALVLGAAVSLQQSRRAARAELAAVEAKAGAKVPAPRVNPKSIVVLPFRNVSDDPAPQAFFVAGLHQDLIAGLAGIRDLHCVPQETALTYRDSKKTMREIADELQVAFVLKATVRREGQKVSLTGELTKATDATRIWSKTYERDVAGMFAVQAELVREIAAELKTVVSTEATQLLARGPTDNPAAYDLFLKARAYGRKSLFDATQRQKKVIEGVPVSQLRESLLTSAVTLDPKFASAWAELARAQSFFHRFGGGDDRSGAARLAGTRRAIEAAIALAPDAPDVLISQGYYLSFLVGDYVRAAAALERAAHLQPNSPDPFYGLALIQRREGRWSDALANLRRAVELDPANADVSAELLVLLAAGRRYAEGAAEKRRSLALGTLVPNDAVKYNEARSTYMAAGSTVELEKYVNNPGGLFTFGRQHEKFADAYFELVKDQKPPGPSFTGDWAFNGLHIAVMLAGKGRMAEARAVLEHAPVNLRARLALDETNVSLLCDLACVEAVLGHPEEALRAARRAVELVPTEKDHWEGPQVEENLAFVYAWTGDKTRAIETYARLLQTPMVSPRMAGNTVHVMRHALWFAPLRGDPRWEALLADPKNNAPLF